MSPSNPVSIPNVHPPHPKPHILSIPIEPLYPHICPYRNPKSPYMAVNQNPVMSRDPPHPLLHTPLSRPVVTYLCRECLAQVCPTKEPCGKGACRKPGDSVTNPCRGTAAEACYKPRVFDSQPYIPIIEPLYPPF